jgi:D-3-phosphoglycerate dehydrogenase
MEVIGYDPFVTGEAAAKLGIRLVDDLEVLFRGSDYISVHTPLTDKTRNMISTKEFEVMKDGVRIINCARGGIVDEAALKAAIESGKVAGAAVDVYPEEPPKDRSLIDLDNVIATPHLGASTEEAQTNVAVDAARQVADVLVRGVVRFAVNMPAVEASQMEALTPYLFLAEKIGAFHRQMADKRIGSVEVTCSGEVTELATAPVTSAVLAGLLATTTEDNVNAINAPLLAAERGIRVTEKKSGERVDYTNMIDVTIAAGDVRKRVAGSILGKGDARIVRIDDYRTDLAPTGELLIVFGKDQPGFIGKVGIDMGEKGVNIAGMTNARREVGGEAVCVFNLDNPAPQEAIDELASLDVVTSVHVVSL